MLREGAEGAPRVTVAPLFRTLGAVLVDGLVIGGLSLALTVAVSGALAGDAQTTTKGIFGALELVATTPSILVAFAAIVLALSLVLNAVLLPLKGATLGGLLTGVRVVVGATGERPNVARAALRGVASAFGGVLLLAGPLWGLWLDPLRRGFGDIVAGTLPAKREGAV